MTTIANILDLHLITTVAIADEVIAAVKAKRAELNVKTVALPETGALVTFKDRKGNLFSGKVLGSKAGAGKGQPALVRVQVGDGFDANVVTVFPSALIAPEANAAVAE